MKKKLIVIGAGVAGLSGAIRLQKAGYDVTIIEKQSRVGGKMNIIEKNGFQFDLGPTIVMLPDIYKDVFTDAGVDYKDYIDMEPLENLYTLYFGDETRFNVPVEYEKFIKSIGNVSPDDAIGIRKYMEDTYHKYLIAKNSFIDKTFRSPFDFYNPKTIIDAFRLKTFDDAYSSISKYVRSDKIRQLLAFQTLYIGISPFQGPSIYTIIPMIEAKFGVEYIKGGMYNMAKGMEKLFLELGGKIILNQEIVKINSKQKQIISILTDKNVIYTADIFLLTADLPYALKHMFDKEIKQKKYKTGTVEILDYTCSCFLMYLGINDKVPKNIDMHNMIFSKDFKQNIDQIFEGIVPQDPSVYVYIPGVLDDSLAPKDNYGMYVLMPVPNLKDADDINWDEEKVINYCKEKMYEKITSIKEFKNIKEKVLFEEIITPFNFRDDSNSMFGATFGLKPTLLQSNYFRPQHKAKAFNNLYFAGASTHPGAGVPLVLTSAKLATQEVIKDYKNE